MLCRASALFFALVCLCTASAPAALGAALRIGVESNYPPFSYKDNLNKRIGFDYETAGALCSALQRPCEIVFGPLQEQLKELETGRLDMVMGVYPTPERRQSMDFSDSLYRMRNVFIGAPPNSKNSDRTHLPRIGARAGSVQAAYLTSLAPGSVVPVLADFAQLVLLLQQHKLDMILTTDLASLHLLASAAGQDFEVIGERLALEALPNDASIALRKHAGNLRVEVNSALRDLHYSGVFERINHNYFLHSLY